MFAAKIVTFSARIQAYKTCKLHKTVFSIFYNISNQILQFHYFKMSFEAVEKDFIFLA